MGSGTPVSAALVATMCASLTLLWGQSVGAQTAPSSYDDACALQHQASRSMDQGGKEAEALDLLAQAADSFAAGGALSEANLARRQIADWLMEHERPIAVSPAVRRAIDELVAAGTDGSDPALRLRGLLARARLYQADGDNTAAARDLVSAGAEAGELGSGLMLAIVAIRVDELARRGVDVPERASLRRAAVERMVARSAGPTVPYATDLLLWLTHVCGHADEASLAIQTAIATGQYALSGDEREDVDRVVEEAGRVLLATSGDQAAATYAAALLPAAQGATNPTARVMALCALANVSPADATVREAMEEALLADADVLSPEQSALAHGHAARSYKGARDHASAQAHQDEATAALLRVTDATRRVEVAARLANGAADQGQGEWAIELLASAQSSLPEGAVTGAARLAIARARIRLDVAQREWQESREAAEMAGQELGPAPSPLDVSRQAAQDDLRTIDPLLEGEGLDLIDPGVLVDLGVLRRELGDPLGSEAALNRAIAAGRQEAAPWLLWRALTQQARTQHDLGREDRAAELAAEALATPAAHEDIWGAYRVVPFLVNVGRYEEAIAATTRIMAQATEDGFRAQVLWHRAWAHLMEGDTEAAAADLRAIPGDEVPGRLASTVLGRANPAPFGGREALQPWLWDWLLDGSMNTRGEARQAVALADAAIAGLRALEANDEALAGWLLIGSEALNLAGRHEDALGSLEGVPEAFEALGDAKHQARALRAQATAHAALGHTGQAEALRTMAEGLDAAP